MALRGKALTAVILALVFLALAVAPTWSMAVLILFGMIAAGKELRKNPALSGPPVPPGEKAPEREMSLRGKALTAINLALVFLALTVAPTWSVAVLILFGMIAAGKEMRTNLAPAVGPPALALPDDALALDVDGLALLAVEAARKESSRSPSGLKRRVYFLLEDMKRLSISFLPGKDAFSIRFLLRINCFGPRSRIIVKSTDLLCKRLVDALCAGKLLSLEELIWLGELIGLPEREVDIKWLVREAIGLRKRKEDMKRKEAIQLLPIDFLSRKDAFSTIRKRKFSRALAVGAEDAGTVDEQEKKKLL